MGQLFAVEVIYRGFFRKPSRKTSRATSFSPRTTRAN
jgi:hypothetical protein